MLLELKQKYRKKLLNRLNQFEKGEIRIDETEIEELRRKIRDLADEKKSIELILQSNPELASNKEFMQEAVQVDYRLLKHDRTNNLNLYIDVLNSIKCSSTIKNDFGRRYGKYKIGFEEFIIKIQEEMQNPKQVDDDKYKIPTKYLFEAIRNGFSVEGQMYLFNNINSYFMLDGTIPKETGAKIQNLYENNTIYLLKHEIHHSKKEENHQIANKICFEGLRSSQQDAGCINNLERTTVGNYQKEITLFNFLPWPDNNNNHILFCIPRDIIDNNKPLWGAEVPEISEGVNSYILPQYVIGFINDEAQICYNPVDVKDRKKYRYLFRNKETVQFNREINDEKTV